MEKIINKHFKEAYYADREINFDLETYDIATADTEVHYYYNGEQITGEQLDMLLLENGEDWVKKNIEVKAWCFSLFVNDTTIAFTNIEDFIDACCLLRLDKVIWYNASFDFPIFDYYFATNGWKKSNDVTKGNSRWKKEHLPDKTYCSLEGQSGYRRYKMTLWKAVTRYGKTHTHKFNMYDFLNVIPNIGGLAKCYEDFDIKDECGNNIRKLEMNYDTDDIKKAWRYIVNDVKGLYFLVMKYNDIMKELTDFSYLNGDYSTIGELSKMTFLSYMYNGDYSDNLYTFHQDFPISIVDDVKFRKGRLFRGGLNLLNKKYKGQVVKNVYKFDINSMYPYMMHNIKYPYGDYTIKDSIQKNDNLTQVIHFNYLEGELKDNMIPIWQDKNKDYTEVIEEQDIFMIKEEFEELCEWYDFYIKDIKEVYCWKSKYVKGMQNFVDDMYEVKQNSKGAMRTAVKLLLNNSFGKFGQCTIRDGGEYELTDDGYMKYKHTGTYIDDFNAMNVIIASKITAMSRCYLLKTIRENCDNVVDDFVYGDTDSIHILKPLNDTLVDDAVLGKFKNEGINKEPFDNAIYIANKNYIMEKNNKAEVVHCGGVDVNKMKELLGECDNIDEMKDIFKSGNKIPCLHRFLCKGGVALINKKIELAGKNSIWSI